jgi:2-polyprenyl-3-methyl-5-hydroxy-6-metoxy-1,4-benzoquinol methylase
MSDLHLTERQQRERSYYEEFARLEAPADISLDPVLGAETRPWNSYWYACQLVKEHFRSPNQKLLDFGCGTGYFPVLFATVGYEVHGFDIAENNVAASRELARRHGLAHRIHLSVGVAEQLDFPDGSFDVVTGIDILHHVDIPRAIAECRRVLRPGGIAIFREPLLAPLFDTLRQSWFGRWLVPNEASFERHITHDERKLSRDDLRTIANLGFDLAIKRFRLLARLHALAGPPRDPDAPLRLELIDERILRRVPALGAFAGTAVLLLRKQ